MTELDPNIILKAFAAPQLDVAGLMERRDQLQQRGIERQRADATYQRQQAEQTRVDAQAAAARGAVQQYGTDQTGARKAAFATGDPDLVSKLDSMDDAGRKRAFDISQHTAPLLLSLKKAPPEQRAAALQQIAPQLTEAGFTPDHIAQVGQDLSDGALDRIGASAMTIAEYQKASEPIKVGPGEHLFDSTGTHEIASVPDSPDLQAIEGANGYVAFDKRTGTYAPVMPAGGAAGAPTSSPGGFAHAVNTVLHNEGGYNPSDMNGAPVNFGINQGANPGVDVKNLTREQAVQIYHDKYWVPSKAETLPANLQTPYFDVYIRNPGFAKQALARSGGDPAKFMQLSSAYFQNLAQKPSGQRYGRAWANRDANNTALAAGGGAAPPGGGQLQGKKKDAEAILDQPTRALMADQYLAGDKSVLQNLGRGTQGAKNIVLLRQEIFSQAQQRGMDGAGIAKAMAQFNGLTASARTIGNIGGKVDYGVNELLQSIPLAEKSSHALPRGQFVPITRIEQMIQSGTSNPALKDFAIKTNAVINAYNLVAGRAGTDVQQRHDNANLLRTADSPEAYSAALAAMGMEGRVAQSASRTTMNGIGNGPSKPSGGNMPSGFKIIGRTPK